MAERPPPKPKGQDDLAEVERALSVLQGRDPEFERARRQDEESRQKRRAQLDDASRGFSFRYDAPNKNRIVSDGTTLKVYIAEDNQMIEKPVEKSQYPGAFGFLMGNGISSSFTFTINEKAVYKDGPVLQGKPTAPTPDYEAATFFINKEKLDKSDPGAVARVSLVDAQGNKNRFDLDGASQPATIDPSEFTFTAPPGTNIIH